MIMKNKINIQYILKSIIQVHEKLVFSHN